MGKKREAIDCEKCKWVIPLMPQNEEAVFLINKAMPGLIAFGNVNYSVIPMIFDLYDVDKSKRPALFEKFQAYISVVLEHMASEGK